MLQTKFRLDDVSEGVGVAIFIQLFTILLDIAFDGVRARLVGHIEMSDLEDVVTIVIDNLLDSSLIS